MATSAERVQEICDTVKKTCPLWVSNIERLHCLIDLVDKVEHLKGDIVELGVFEGQTAQVLALAASNKIVHLFDTFKGIPVEALSVHDLPKLKGYFYHPDVHEEYVRKALSHCPNVEFHVGLIEETLPAFNKERSSLPLVKPSLLSFIHFDCDTYNGHAIGLKLLWPLLEVGGYCLFHDYTCSDCKGAAIAVDEFFGDARKRLRGTAGGFLMKKER